MTPASVINFEGLFKALVLPDNDPRWGGTSVSVPALGRAMHAQDASVRLYFAESAPVPNQPAFFQAYPKSTPPVLHRSRALRRALCEGSFGIVHHHALWLPSLRYADLAARRSNCPLMISPRGMLSPYALARARWKKWLARRLLHPGALERAAAWHATSHLEFNDIRRAGFRQPIFVSPNGIELPVWDEARDRQAWLARYPRLEGQRICLFFSRLHSKKGIFPLLDAWARLAPGNPNWHLLLSGTPHEFQIVDVQREVKRLKLESNVTVADPTGLAKPYPLAELYVLPSFSENFGLTIGEALGMGLPVLTSNMTPWGPLNELDCGACVPLDRFEAQLRVLLALDATQLRAMGERGRLWIQQDFSWSSRAAEMLAFYRTISR